MMIYKEQEQIYSQQLAQVLNNASQPMQSQDQMEVPYDSHDQQLQELQALLQVHEQISL
jgi:hypothetical protein